MSSNQMNYTSLENKDPTTIHNSMVNAPPMQVPRQDQLIPSPGIQLHKSAVNQPCNFSEI